MDDLLEFLFELLFDGAMEGAASKYLPKWLRILLLTVPFAGLAVLFGVLAYDIFANGPIWLAGIMAAVTLVVLIVYVVLVYRITKGIPRKKRRDEPVGNENPDEE